MKDLISIVVPIYKVEEYLNRCIDSIINQTYKNLEIILVDDGSPDNCPIICDNYEMIDNRIKVIHKTNGGLSEARNFGINKANGQYIMFVDSDDFIHYQMIEILYKSIIIDDSDISICEHKLIYKNDVNIVDFPDYNVEKVNIEDSMNNLLIKAQWVTATAKLYKKSLFDDVKFPVGKIYEDTYVTYLLFHKSNKIKYVNLELYYYFQRDDSIMGINGMRKYLDLLEIYFKRMDFFFENGYERAGLLQRNLIEKNLHEAYKYEEDEEKTKEIKKLNKIFIKKCFKTYDFKYKLVLIRNYIFNII